MWGLETILRMNAKRPSWSSGRYTSIPDDGRCFLEVDNHNGDLWWAYRTGNDGRMLQGFPKLRDEPFASVEAAQAWVESNVAPHPNYQPDALSRAVSDGVEIKWDSTDKVDDLEPEINTILEALGLLNGRTFISDRSTLGDLIHDREVQHAKVMEQLGVVFALDDYVYEVARKLRDAG